MNIQTDLDIPDCTANPELILQLAEDGDNWSCDETEQLWLAGQHVTHPPHSHYND